jgi:hypothetical protein
MKKASLSAVLVVLVAVAVSLAGPASATPPHHPPHPGSNPTVGTSSADVPVTCTFGAPSPVFATIAHVSVTAPSDTHPRAPYTASFLVTLDGIVAPFDVATFSMMSTYDVSGPVDPNGAVVFTETPQSLAVGESPTSTTFTQTFTPGPHGTISYRFDAVSYDFAFGGTDTIHAACTLDDGPVVVRQTSV